MHHYIPLEVRQQNYNKVRSKIFLNEELKGDNYRNVPKVRQIFAEKRQVIKSVIDSIKRANDTDPRSFAEVEVEGIKIKGLLDTGASVSVLGNGCRELIEGLNCKMKTIFTNVKTAAGQEYFRQSKSILGKVRVKIEYQRSENCVS